MELGNAEERHGVGEREEERGSNKSRAREREPSRIKRKKGR